MRQFCEQHEDAENLTKSTSRILLNSHASVHQKDHSSSPCKFKSNGKFRSYLPTERNSGSNPEKHSWYTCQLRNANSGKFGNILSVFQNSEIYYSKSSDGHSPSHYPYLSVTNPALRNIFLSFLFGVNNNKKYWQLPFCCGLHSTNSCTARYSWSEMLTYRHRCQGHYGSNTVGRRYVHNSSHKWTWKILRLWFSRYPVRSVLTWSQAHEGT